MAGISKVTAALGGVVSALGAVSAAASTTRASVAAATAAILEHHGSMQKSAETASAGVMASMSAAAEHVTTRAAEIESRGQQLADRTDKVRHDVGTRLDDLIDDMDLLATNGNLWSQQLLDLLLQVKQGTLDAKDVLFSFGDAVVDFDGKIQPLRDVLQDVLPTMGQVQQGIRDMTEELKNADPSEIVDRLKEQYNQFAQALARGVDMFKQGQISLERLMQLVQQAQKLMPGSETDALAQLLEQALKDGRI